MFMCRHTCAHICLRSLPSGLKSIHPQWITSRHLHPNCRVPMLAHLAYASYVAFPAEMSTNAATWLRGHQGVCWSAFTANYLATVTCGRPVSSSICSRLVTPSRHLILLYVALQSSKTKFRFLIPRASWS